MKRECKKQKLKVSEIERYRRGSGKDQVMGWKRFIKI